MIEPHFFYFSYAAAAAAKSLQSCPTLSLLEYLVRSETIRWSSQRRSILNKEKRKDNF